KVVEIRRRTAHVVIQTAVDVVITGGVSVLNTVVVQDLEDFTGLRELGGQAVVDDVAQLNGEYDVLLARVIDDPLQGLRHDLRIVGVLVKEVLGVGDDHNTEFLAAGGRITAAVIEQIRVVGGVRRNGCCQPCQGQQCGNRQCAR